MSIFHSKLICKKREYKCHFAQRVWGNWRGEGVCSECVPRAVILEGACDRRSTAPMCLAARYMCWRTLYIRQGVCDIFRKRNVICLLRKRCGKSIECHPERNAVKPKDPTERAIPRAVILERKRRSTAHTFLPCHFERNLRKQ
jgi:hypothetical protein